MDRLRKVFKRTSSTASSDKPTVRRSQSMPLQVLFANISPPMALSPPSAAYRKENRSSSSLPRSPSIQDNRDQSLHKLTDASRQYRTHHRNASAPIMRWLCTKRSINLRPESSINSQSPTRRQYSRFSKPLPPIPSKPPAGSWGKVDPSLRDMEPVLRQAPVRRLTEERAEVIRSVHCEVEEI